MRKNWKRILAAMLAASMIFGNSVPAYATEVQYDVELVEENIEEDVEEAEAETVETETVETETVETEMVEADTVTSDAEEAVIEETTENVTEEEAKVSEEVLTVSSEEKDTYTGNVEIDDEGNSHLYVYHWEVTNNGGTFDNATILSILQARIDAGESYEQVMIAYPDIPGVVSKDVWNAVKTLMKNDEWSAGFLFNGDDYMDKNWFVAGMQEATADVVLDGTLTLGAAGELGSISFANTDFPAEGVHIRFGTYHWNDGTADGTGGRADYADYVAAFGTESFAIDLYTNDTLVEDTSVRYEYYSESPGNDNLDVCVDNIGGLDANVTYQLEKRIYKGRVDEWDDGNLALNINSGEAEKESLTDQDVMDILAYHEKGSFREITIEQNDGNYKISAELANAAKEYLAEPTEEASSDLRFGFWDDDAKVYFQWGITNPGTQTEDQNVFVEYTAEDGKAPTVKLSSQTLVGDQVFAHVNINAESNPEYYNQTIAYLGNGQRDMQLEGTEAGGWYDYDEWSLWMDIRNIENLTAGTVYNVIIPPYTGDVNDYGNGRRGLFLNPYDAGKDEAFTLAELQEILENHKGELYDNIELVIPESDSNVIKSDIAEELVKYQADQEEYNEFLFFTFQGDGYSTVVGLVNPGENPTYDKDVTVDIEITFDETTGKITYNVGKMQLNGESGLIGYNHTKESGLGKDIFEYYGGTDGYWYDMEDTENPEVSSWYVPNWNDIYLEVGADDIWDGTAKTWNLTKAAYTGTIEEWDNGEHVLCLYHNDFNDFGLEFNEDTILDILKTRENTGEKFDRVQISFPEITNEISADLWNAALTVLADNDEAGLQLNFGGGDDCDEGWWFYQPKNTENDINLNVDFVIGSEGNYGTVKFANTEFPADYVHVDFGSWAQNEDGKPNLEDFRKAFGTDYLDLDLLDESGNYQLGIDAAYHVYENEDGYKDSSVSLGDVKLLNAGATSKFALKEYRGDFNDDGEYRSLFISSYGFGKDKLEAKDVKDIILFYENLGITFNAVEFEQAKASSNTISKELINLAGTILQTDEEFERRVTFIFCNCEENEDGEWIQDDLRWNFVNPGNATKDINANITMSAVANYGVTLKFNANTYNAEEVFVQYQASESIEMAEDLCAALNMDSELMLLKKSSEIVQDRGIGLSSMDDGRVVDLFIGGVQRLEAKTEYLVCNVQYLNNPEDESDYYVVGQPATIELTYPVDAGTSVTWKSHSPEKTEVAADGTVSFLSNGGEHYISAQYKSGGKNVFEFFWARAEVCMEAIAFCKSNYNVEFWPDGVDDEDANRGHLDIRYYPANTGMDPVELKWEILEGDDVIEFVPRSETEGADGEIRALKEGTAKVKVSHPENEALSATCTVKVTVAEDWVPEEVWNGLGYIYAFSNVDKTLADVKLPEGYEWVNPKTSLKNYYDVSEQSFEAVYTDSEGREYTLYPCVSMLTIEDIYARPIGIDENGEVIVVDNPTKLVVGDKFTWGLELQLKNDWGYDAFWDEVDSGRFSFVWSSNLGATDEDSVVGADAEDARMFTAEKTGTYKFTLSIRDNKTGKDIKKTSWSLKVYEKLVNFDEMIFDMRPTIENDSEDWTKGTIHFIFPEEEYVKLSSVKVSDKKVVKIGAPVVETYTEDGRTYVDTYVTYEDGIPGMTALTITAADSAKSTWSTVLGVVDRDPKLLQTYYQINKAYDYNITMCNIQFANGYNYAKDTAEIKVVGDYANVFEYVEDTEHSNYDTGKIIGFLKLKNDVQKTGTYNVDLKIPVDMSADGGTVSYYQTTVKVKVIDKAPSVTVKQTEKVNVFYTQSEESLEGSGTLTINTGKLYLEEEPSIVGVSDFTIVPAEGEDGVFKVIYTPDDDGVMNKSVTLKLELVDDVNGCITLNKTVNIKTEDKAPTVVPSTKTDTLYPKQGVYGAAVYLTEKATGEEVKTWKTSIVLNKKKGETLEFSEWTEEHDGTVNVTLSKNEVNVGRETDEFNVIYFAVNNSNCVDSTEKFTVNVQEANWSRPVSFTYTLKVATKAPKLQLGSSKLTLNANEELNDSQIARTTLTLANCSTPFWSDVYFTGTDAKSKEVLNKGLSLWYDGERGEIAVGLNTADDSGISGTAVKPGTYSYKVWANNGAYSTSTTLKITVVDKTPASCIKLSKKGTIDVLRSDSTSIVYTPKVSNLDGTIVNAWLEGNESYLFNAYLEDGKLVVKANPEFASSLNTKHTYSVTPVFELENSDGGRYSVSLAKQSIKVTQGKPKVTVTAYNGNTIYSSAGNELKLYMDAVLNNEDIAISNVELLNYTDDLWYEFDPETQSVVLSRMYMNQITVDGKTWALKFAVTFVDSAGNEKPVQVTYKVIVK